MAAPQSAQPGNRLINNQVLVYAVALLLPGLAPSIFGWANGLLAIPVFFLLCLNGQEKGTLLIRNGIVLAAIAALFLKLIPTLLFSLTMVPLGFSFYKSYNNRIDAVRAGMRGAIILAASWLIFWTVYGTLQEINPYLALLKDLDTAFEQLHEIYRSRQDLPAETIAQLGLLLNTLRKVTPVILPGLLCCIVIITVWLNLLFCSSLIARLQPDITPWEKFSQWRLPDKFVWVLIAAGLILLLGRENSSQVGIGMLLISSLIYFFQGLAVFIHLLDKWNVPLYLRIFIYIILILQSYGLLLLILAGIADVRFNFRRASDSDNMSGE